MSKRRQDILEVRKHEDIRADRLVLKGKWHWHLKSAYNGKIKCSGQASGFSSKAKALAGWEAVAGAAKAGVKVVEI